MTLNETPGRGPVRGEAAYRALQAVEAYLAQFELALIPEFEQSLHAALWDSLGYAEVQAKPAITAK